jgi:hypothetical protein
MDALPDKNASVPSTTKCQRSATTVPLIKLSLIDIVSGVGKKLFNLR